MTTGHRQVRRLMALLALLGVVSLLLIGCGSKSPEPVLSPTAPPEVEPSQIITLGDIDPDEPVKKINRFTPLADYLVQHLAEYSIADGRVVIADNIEEMGRFMRDGTVDIYFDSPFPTLAVQDLSGSRIILRRWKKGLVSYSSTYIALRDGDVRSVDDFLGKVMAFEEPRSTSGFILPAGTLVQRGFALRRVDGPDAEVAPDEIGYYFSRDEENTVELVRLGVVAGGGVSNQDYDDLPEELKELVVTFDKTIKVPRQLVSLRDGLDPALVAKIGELLIGLDQTDEGRGILEGLKKTKKFDPLPSDSEARLTELKKLMDLIAGN